MNFRNELDGMDQQEKYPPGFRVIIEMVVSNPPPSHEPHPVDQGLSNTIERPLVLFRDGTDFKQTMTDYGMSPFRSLTSDHCRAFFRGCRAARKATKR